MKKWISNAFLLGMLFVFATIIPERQTNAAEEYTYYLTINQVYQYEITKEQFESIRGSWDSLTAEGVLEIDRSCRRSRSLPGLRISVFAQYQKIVRREHFRFTRLIRKKILQRIMILLFRRAFCCGIREVRKW